MALASGTQLGRYEIITSLGAGGMGEVYLARDTQLERLVALKILPAHLASDEKRLRRFILEAKAASSLNHPNILTIFEIGQTDTAHFITAEYIEGQTLRHYMAHARPHLTEVLDICTQVGSALSAAHEVGIIHRDVKPENIMIRRDGLVKVLDFGLAKLTAQEPLTVDTQAPTKALLHTDPGIVLGTTLYMSPEQARGITVDARTDIFSLGVVLYEMVGGTRPFEGRTTSDVLSSLLSEKEPQPLERYSREVPAELERIVSKALRKNRDERYQTVKDLLLDLKSLRQELEFERKLERLLQPKSKMEADTRALAEAKTNSESAPVFSKEARSQFKLNRSIVVIAALLFIASAAGAYLYFGRTRSAAINSIAVLPFVNASGDPNMEYLSDGIAESLMNSLSQLPNLKVMSRNTAFHYKGKEQNAEKVGKELNVRAVLSGSLKQIGDQVVISVSLDDCQDNHQIWGAQYNRKVSDLLLVQREIGREIISNLKMKLSRNDENRLEKHHNPEAYQLYLKGRFYWNKRTSEAARKSIDYFNQAIALDPNYALGYAGLSDAYFVLTISDSPQESFPKAKAAAQHALELDDTLAEPHASLGATLFFYDRDFPGSQREFQRALELDPNYATGHHWYGVTYLAKMGQFEDAIAELKRAQELDPLSVIINSDLGNVYLQAGQYDNAIEQLRKTIDMDQSFYYAHWQLGSAYEMKGSFQEATREYQRARELNDDPWMLALLGHVSAVSGRRDEALKLLNELKEISKRRYVSSYSFAVLNAGLGDKDQAFQWLQKSCENHEPRITRLKVDSFVDNLRSDPRFADVLRCAGLAQ